MGKPSKEKCQSEVGYLLDELISWREESSRQFSNIINLHISNINKGINDLDEEVSDLQTKLSMTTKEKDDLHENVAKLSSENRQLKAVIHNLQPLPKYEQVNFPADQTQINQEGHDINLESYHQEQLAENVVIDSIEEEEYENPTDTKRNFIIENTNADDIEIKQEALNLNEEEFYGDDISEHGQEGFVSESEKKLTCFPQTVHSKDHICPVCSLVFSTRGSLRIHFRNRHPKLKLSDKLQRENRETWAKSDNLKMQESKISKGLKFVEKRNNRKQGKRVKCEQCPYETVVKNQMKQHIKAVHQNIRDHICKECGYAASEKRNLKRHTYTVHERGDKNFKCNQCSFSAYQKQDLNRHIKRVHDEIRDHKCEYCEYYVTEKWILKKHMKSIHKIG